MKISASVIIFLVISSCATTSKIPVEDSFEKIIEAPNISKDELYVIVNAWFVEQFQSAESVIEFQDKEAGRVMGKYVFKAFDGSTLYQWIISVDVKESKVRIRFYEPRLWNEPFGGTAHWKDINSFGVTTRNHHLTRYFMRQYNRMTASLEERLKVDDEW